MRTRHVVAAVLTAAVVTALAANTADQEPYSEGPFGRVVHQVFQPQEDDPAFNCHVHGNRVCGPHDHTGH